MIAPASRKVGKFAIRQKLGRGGMADVYLATDSVLGNTLALKLIEHSPDPDTNDAIEAERRGSVLQSRLAAVDHRVVQIYDAGDADGFFYVAMEYVDGQDLSDLMKGGPLVEEFAVDAAIAVAETLENAHNLEVELGGKTFHGIVHGDIKPKNIRIDSQGRVRVLDFGIAKALSLTRRLTRNDFGSVGYGSPERLESGEVNEQSDLWSLAVMLYEMVTGLQPYQATTTELLDRMIRSHIPPPPAPDPCPTPLRRVLIKAMAPEAEDRYQTAREFREDLMAFRKGEPVQAILENLDGTRRTHTAAGRATSPRPVHNPPVAVLVEEETRKTAHDDDETRRTAPDDSTRRTEPVASKPDAPAQQASMVWGAKPRKPSALMEWLNRSLWGRRVTAGVVGLIAIGAVWAAGSDVVLYRHGSQLERQIASEQITDPNAIWDAWTAIAGDNPSSWLLRGARKAVEQKLTSAADRVIDGYRNSDTVIYETSWKAAQSDLSHALLLDPDDTVRGKLRLTEGHLARIASNRDHGTAGVNDLNQAVEKFTEAEHLLPKSPDPELGLARVYVYGLKDIDRAYHALQEAEKRGYPMGNREKAYLADGYKDRADRLFLDSQHNVRGLPQEKDEIQRAKEDYEQALELYQAIAPYANANGNIVKVQDSLEGVNFRLQEIQLDSNPFAPNDPGLSAKHNRVPPWLSGLLRAIWASRGDKK